jgi:hypothetical protein
MMFFWNPVIFSSAGYYLMAVADFMDGAAALSARPTTAERRRPQLKVIQGGRSLSPDDSVTASTQASRLAQGSIRMLPRLGLYKTTQSAG